MDENENRTGVNETRANEKEIHADENGNRAGEKENPAGESDNRTGVNDNHTGTNDNPTGENENGSSDHRWRLPTVRIAKAVLDNFKSVHHGVIEFDCGKHYVPYGTQSDILGIYGQNGSGKTSFIEALNILKGLLIGARIPREYTECIAKNADSASMEFTFDLQYPDGEIRKAVYFCQLGTAAVEKEEDDTKESDDFDNGLKIRVISEKISIAGDYNGKKIRLQTVIDTSAGTPFGPAVRLKSLTGNKPEAMVDLEVSKRLSSERSTSFVFARNTMKIFKENCEDITLYEILSELRFYGRYYLFVLETRSAGFIRLNFGIPIYTRSGLIRLMGNKPITFANKDLPFLTNVVSDIDLVMNKLVPGMSIRLKTLSETILKNGEKGHQVEIVSIRDGVELPLRCESDGVRKIISEISLIISAYNDQSMTIAIDEFDAGIFEYLLGEILQIFEESGKGQFIFTSHNLRPLEVIDKKFLYFTTTNPDNRYIRLKNIGKTNNLRNTYFREIILGEQDEEIYRATQKYKIVEALQKVGKRKEERAKKAYYESQKNQAAQSGEAQE